MFFRASFQVPVLIFELGFLILISEGRFGLLNQSEKRKDRTTLYILPFDKLLGIIHVEVVFFLQEYQTN